MSTTELAADSAAVFDAIVASRRSVRKFTEEAIPESVIEHCLDLALLAPNSSNLQPWEFHWIRTPEKKAATAKICFDQQAATTASDMIAVVARTATWREHARETLANWPGGDPPKIVVDYYAKICPVMYTQGPLGILGALKRVAAFGVGLFRVAPREPSSHADMRVWATKTAALAAENLMLGLEAHGYGTCPMEGFDSVRLRRLLGLPRDAATIMIVAAGRAAEEGIYGPRQRFDRERFIHRL